jgi:hypothetical protein
MAAELSAITTTPWVPAVPNFDRIGGPGHGEEINEAAEMRRSDSQDEYEQCVTKHGELLLSGGSKLLLGRLHDLRNAAKPRRWIIIYQRRVQG